MDSISARFAKIKFKALNPMRLSKTPPFSTLKKSPFREDINVEKGEL
jgi:hypothetical protein